MEHQIPWDLLLRTFQNPTEEDFNELDLWILENKENQKIYDELKVIYEINGSVPAYYKPDMNIGWRNIEKRVSASGGREKILRLFSRVAAAVVMLIVGAGSYWAIDQHLSEDKYAEVYSPYGHKTMVLLPDSSKVWLNGDSKLRYNTNFSNERSLELEGEAMFDVKKDPDKMFSVKSNKLRVEVYGTTFNFRTYNNDEEAEVALLKGSVGIFKEKQYLKTMAAGEVVTYLVAQNKLISTKNCDLQQITSWNSDQLVIENMPIPEIFKYLERWYGVHIDYNGLDDTNQKLSFKVKTESLREILSIINIVYPFSYKIDGKNVVITNL